MSNDFCRQNSIKNHKGFAITDKHLHQHQVEVQKLQSNEQFSPTLIISRVTHKTHYWISKLLARKISSH